MNTIDPGQKPTPSAIPVAANLTIPWPAAAPFGATITAADVDAAWNEFVKPSQDDDAAPQSVEMRILMGILRSVYDGMHGLTVRDEGHVFEAKADDTTEHETNPATLLNRAAELRDSAADWRNDGSPDYANRLELEARDLTQAALAAATVALAEEQRTANKIAFLGTRSPSVDLQRRLADEIRVDLGLGL